MAVRIQLCEHTNCWRSKPFCGISMPTNHWELLGSNSTFSYSISRPHHNADVVKILHFSGWSFKLYSWNLLKDFLKQLNRCFSELKKIRRPSIQIIICSSRSPNISPIPDWIFVTAFVVSWNNLEGGFGLNPISNNHGKIQKMGTSSPLPHY